MTLFSCGHLTIIDFDIFFFSHRMIVEKLIRSAANDSAELRFFGTFFELERLTTDQFQIITNNMEEKSYLFCGYFCG